MPFALARHAHDDTIRIVASGELDAETGPQLEEEVRLAEREAPGVLVLDLDGLDFFDSTGLQIVLDADRRAREAGRRLVVAARNGEPLRVLKLAGVLDELELES